MSDSIWKKDISLKRKPKADVPPQPERDAAEPTSMWKKEISFGRKRKPKAETADSPETAVELTPFWKREITLSRKPKAEAPASPPVKLVPEPEPVALEAVPEPVAAPPVEPVVLSVPQPEPAPPAEPVLPEPPVSWVDAVLSSREPAPAPRPVEAAPPPAPEPEPEPAPPVSLELPPPLLVAPPPPVQAVPPLPPVLEQPPLDEPATATEPRPVRAPVTADQLPSLDAGSAKVPWHKKELFAKSQPKAKPERSENAAPFWKKELSLKRAPRQKAENLADEDAAPKPGPFWKKELSLGRKPKAESAPKPKPASSQPFWKRGISLPSLSLPQRGSGSRSVPKQLVGLKVGASQLAAARVSNNGHAEVLQVARQPLDAGIVVGGELRDPDALAEHLKEFFRRNKLPKKGVRLGIANNRIGVRTFEIGGIDDPKQLANAIRFRAQEALPIPIEEAVLDYQVLGERADDEGQHVRKILLVVAYRELVDRYVGACKKAGIQLAGIDLEAFALLRALAAPPEGGLQANAALVAVAVGHDRSTFAVSDGRVCEFTRVLEWGGQNLNVAIARALDMAPSEAEPYKRALSLAGGPAPEGMTEQQAAVARDAIVQQVNTFARELVSSLQFYQSQPNSLGIGEIVLTGGTTHLDGFAEELQKVIGVRVRIGDPLVRVKVARRVREPEQLGSLAVAIGLGIED